MKKIVFVFILFLIVFFLGRNLNPFSSQMFTFHDETQPARIAEFVLNLKNLNIPPRVAPNFSFQMGYPVFNFYAPFSYWATSFITLLGFDIVFSLKLSFLLAIVFAFIFTFLFLNIYFDFYPSLFGAAAYISSLFFAAEIFVRGNLAEVWFLTLFPLTLFLLYKNSLKINRKIFFITSLILSFLFTSHNLLSPISYLITFIFILLLKNKRVNFLALFLGTLLTSYFWLPVVFEINLTYAKQVAALTNYKDHFLCLYQLWQSPWGYGGSTPGCINDGMSFKIGKLQLIFFISGVLLYLYQIFIKRKKSNKIIFYLLFSTFYFLFMTTYQFQPLWEFLSPAISIVQFPWRFIGPSLLGISFFAGYFFQNLKIPFKNLIIFLSILFILFTSSKYFYKPPIGIDEFKKKYLSLEYIQTKAAYKIAEYLPKTVDYQYWRSLEKNPNFAKKPINIHYFPYWKIYLNDELIKPDKFDLMGRPIVNLDNKTIKIVYEQTLIEKIGNLITLSTLVILSTLGKKSKIALSF